MHMYIYNMPKDASKDYPKDIEDVFHIDSVDEKINGSSQLTVIIDSSYLVKATWGAPEEKAEESTRGRMRKKQKNCWFTELWANKKKKGGDI